MKHSLICKPPLWLACILSFVIAIAFGALALSLAASQCAKNLKCIGSFQYAYLATMNEAITSYPDDVYSCHARGYPELVDFLALEDKSTKELECAKMRPNQGFITKVITPPTRTVKNSDGTQTMETYRDEAFGLEFGLVQKNSAGSLAKNGTRLASSVGSGSITRFEIEKGSNFRMALMDLITASDTSNLDVCSVDFYPWMPNGDTAMQLGNIEATINHKNYEQIAADADKKASKLNMDEGSQGWEAFSMVAKAVNRDCSQYANTSESGGYFLYNPTVAPDHFYFVERTSKAGSPNFYEWGSIKILP